MAAQPDAERARTEAQLLQCTFAEFESLAAAYLDECDRLYDNDEPLRAYQLYRLVIDVANRRASTSASDDQRTEARCFLDLATRTSEDPRHELVRACGRELFSVVAELDDTTSWTTAREKGRVKTFFKMTENSSTMTFKIEGEANTNIFNLLATLLEADLYNRWITSCKQSFTVSSYSRFRKIVHLTIGMPWPLSDRELLLNGYGDVLVDPASTERPASVVVFMRSVRVDEYAKFGIEGKRGVSMTDSVVRMDMRLGGFQFVPLDENRTFVRLLLNVKPQIKFIPESLVNYFMKNFCHWFIPLITDHAVKFETDESLRSRITSNPYVYEEIKLRLQGIRL